MAYRENQTPQPITPAPVRAASGFAPTGTSSSGKGPGAPGPESTSRVSKATRRRAVLACVSCRARKVRCDVVEGSPCGNCKWDNVPCIIVEGRRQVKRYLTVSKAVVDAEEKINGGSLTSRHAHIQPRPALGVDGSEDESSARGTATDAQQESDADESIQASEPKTSRTHRHPRRDRTANLLTMLQVVASADPNVRQLLAGLSDTQTVPKASSPPLSSTSPTEAYRLPAPPVNEGPQDQIPSFIAPLPSRVDAEDTRYLRNKGALVLPSLTLQSALQQAYVEYVHPCLPLLDLSEFLRSVNPNSRSSRSLVSLLLYQAVMFAASAFVDMEYLRQEGFSSRRAARRTFFQRTRLLYDFDYEDDRLVVIQSLLLMTFWHERPEQKDTWHWTGVAISMAYTIGLHRSSSVIDMPVRQQRLWRRIWWSCVHRDRQVSLGMRRPIRIKDGTYDVPMLTESDFEIEALPEDATIVSAKCAIIRDLGMQYELATICVSMARLCVCIGNVFKTQLNEIEEGDRYHNSRSSVEAVDEELTAWAESLRANCRYQPPTASDIASGRGPIVVQRSFVHMVYHTSVLCLHRPQSLPPLPSQLTTSNKQIQDVWHQRVHESAMQITQMASKLRELRLERYLPLTGVSVILPAMTIQLLEMKSPLPLSRQRAVESFRQCMGALEGLRDTYAAADYATDILGSAFAQLNLDGDSSEGSVMQQSPSTDDQADSPQIPPIENAPYMTSYEILFSAKFVRHHLPSQSIGNDSHRNSVEEATGSADASLVSSVYQVDRSWELTGAHGTGLATESIDPYGFEAADLGILRGHCDDVGWDSMTKEDVDMTQWLGLLPEDVNYLNRF